MAVRFHLLCSRIESIRLAIDRTDRNRVRSTAEFLHVARGPLPPTTIVFFSAQLQFSLPQFTRPRRDAFAWYQTKDRVAIVATTVIASASSISNKLNPVRGMLQSYYDCYLKIEDIKHAEHGHVNRQHNPANTNGERYGHRRFKDP